MNKNLFRWLVFFDKNYNIFRGGYIVDVKEIEKNFIEYINYHKGVVSAFGKLEFTNSNRIGQGGNGLVYLAKINEKEIAIKFLISNSKSKINRFKSEYFNMNYITLLI